jgi:hypothetical protein
MEDEVHYDDTMPTYVADVIEEKAPQKKIISVSSAR